MEPQLLLAAWGAALSTLLGLIALRGWRLDRPSISVSATCGHVASSGDVIKVSVANTGRRPTTIVAIGATDFARKPGSVVADDLCALLTEGAHVVEVLDREEFAARIEVESSGLADAIRYIWVRDAAGRQFRSAEFPLRR